jgi:hypothetical protein
LCFYGWLEMVWTTNITGLSLPENKKPYVLCVYISWDLISSFLERAFSPFYSSLVWTLPL